MEYYDQHLHTFLSFDSEEKFENYLTYQPDYFIATDHFDLANPVSEGQDDIPDYQMLTQVLTTLAPQTTTTLLKGIEIGVVPGQEQRIYDYLTDHPYDLTLVSIHQNGTFDYMDDVVLTLDKYQVARQYFDQMERVVNEFQAGHILTHFEYGLRKLNFSPEELATHFEKQLTRIFTVVAQRELGFELNAKSFSRYQNSALYQYAIPLYQSVGGKLFTLGSDAHVAADYRLAFSEMSQMLASFGVAELAVFQGKERFSAPLPL